MSEKILRCLHDDIPLDINDITISHNDVFNILTISKEYKKIKRFIKFLLTNEEYHIVSNFYYKYCDKDMVKFLIKENLLGSLRSVIHWIDENKDEEILDEVIDIYGSENVLDVASDGINNWVIPKMLDIGFMINEPNVEKLLSYYNPDTVHKLISIGYNFDHVPKPIIINSLNNELVLRALDNGMNILNNQQNLFNTAFYNNDIFLYELLTGYGLKIQGDLIYYCVSHIKDISFLNILLNDGINLHRVHKTELLRHAVNNNDHNMIDYMIKKGLLPIGASMTSYINHSNFECFEKLVNMGFSYGIMDLFNKSTYHNQSMSLYLFEKDKDAIIKGLPTYHFRINEQISPEVLEKIIKYIKPKNVGIIYSEECIKIFLRHGFKMSWIDEYKYVSYLNHDPEYKSNDQRIQKIISWNNYFGYRLLKSNGLCDVLVIL